MEESYEKRCAHPTCVCLMQEDEEFCSDACEANAGGDGACECGHLGCEAEAKGDI